MTLIKELAEMIEDELDGAKEYAMYALKLKDEQPTLAKTYYDIATDELRHVGLLHGEVVMLIEKHRREHGEPPASMTAVWNYLHEKHIAKTNEIKMLLSQYRA
jgi:Mn-containing catalase